MDRKKVLHISTECYPAAKAGGMGDVVGALPIYMPQFGFDASVIIPKYANAWIGKQKTRSVFKSSFMMDDEEIQFGIELVMKSELDFPLYLIDIPGKFDRANIYLADNGQAYTDEILRYISFQRAVLEWLIKTNERYDLLHCHDHMTALICFMIKHQRSYKVLQDTATVFTIHNGQYRGIMDWSNDRYLGDYDTNKQGLLDWDGHIHSLATGIKCAWKVTTVSPSYMIELQEDFDNLTSLIRFEKYKSTGIINGIDSGVWDPRTDPLIQKHLKRSNRVFKRENKRFLASEFGFDPSKALVSFIGRFAYEKSADLLTGAFRHYLKYKDDLQFFILGSGDKDIERSVGELQNEYPDNVISVIAYNEQLAHQIYAASDFILMPSRFEPCGLNQMYAMRYGTIPIVRHTGGLIDTVPDIGDDGNGISFLRANEEDIVYSLNRAVDLYADKLSLELLINKIMKLDFSWNRSAELYSDLYKSIII